MAIASPSKPRPKSRWRDLFFIKRRPHLRGIPLDWTKPADDDTYQKMIRDEGFISAKYWEGDDISQHPVIAHDLRDLEQYLLPTFFEFSQKSRYYQNRFYLYQWVFVCGAFLTTLFGTLATLFYVPGTSAAATANTGQAINWQQISSYLTAIVGALTAFVTALSNRGEPQKRWGKTRRLAEELRVHYFNYLSHLSPYDQPDRLQKLRANVIEIRVKEQENG